MLIDLFIINRKTNPAFPLNGLGCGFRARMIDIPDNYYQKGYGTGNEQIDLLFTMAKSMRDQIAERSDTAHSEQQKISLFWKRQKPVGQAGFRRERLNSAR